jgi:DNA-binding helix-turn-helix protein
MCKEAEVSRASLTDLKMGRKQSLSADTLSKIASYFGVSVDSLLGNEPKGKAPSKVGEGHRPPDEETLHLLEVLENRPDIRYLAAASERATPEHVKATAKMFDELYGRGNDK